MIVILAPMLADTERTLDLAALYKTLCQDRLDNEKDEDGMMIAIKASVHTSV